MRPQGILSVCLLAATSSAWPSFISGPVEAVKREIAPLLAERQDGGDSTTTSKFNLSFSAQEGEASSTATSDNNSDATTTGENDSSSATPTDDSNSSAKSGDSSATTGSNTSGGSSAKETGKTTGKSSGGSKTSDSPKTTSFDPRLPAGGVSMITPNAMSPSSYYKIHDWVTFAWNYTSLSAAPSYVDVLASCSKNQATYTIAANQSWSQQQTILWDTGAYQASATIPLLTETYTLVIHDAAKDVSATAGSGYLGTWNQFTFGMYSPQPYTPIQDYVCATCSSAMTQMEKQTWMVVFFTAGVTIMTFSWFTGMAGVW